MKWNNYFVDFHLKTFKWISQQCKLSAEHFQQLSVFKKCFSQPRSAFSYFQIYWRILQWKWTTNLFWEIFCILIIHRCLGIHVWSQSIAFYEFMFDLNPQISMNWCLISIHRFLRIDVWSQSTDFYFSSPKIMFCDIFGIFERASFR